MCSTSKQKSAANEIFVFAPDYSAFRREDRDWERIRLGIKSPYGKTSSETMACPTRGLANSNPATTASSPLSTPTNPNLRPETGSQGNRSNPGSPTFRPSFDTWRGSDTLGSPGSSSTATSGDNTPGSLIRHARNRLGELGSENSYSDGTTTTGATTSAASETEHTRAIRIDDKIFFAFSSINGKSQLHSSLADLSPYFVPIREESDEYYDDDNENNRGGDIRCDSEYDDKIEKMLFRRLVGPVPSNTDMTTLYPEYSVTFMVDMRYSMASTDTEYSCYLDRITIALNRAINALTQKINFNYCYTNIQVKLIIIVSITTNTTHALTFFSFRHIIKKKSFDQQYT